MSITQAEQEVLTELRKHNGSMPAKALSTSLKNRVSDAQRRAALLNLASRYEVKVASGEVRIVDASLAAQ